MLHYSNNCSRVNCCIECFFQFIFEDIFKLPITKHVSNIIMTQFLMTLVDNWSTSPTSRLYYNISFSGTQRKSVSLLLAFEVFCLCWSKPKRLCHTVLNPKIRTSPNYFPKSLLNVHNLFCYTNCLQCFFFHFHVLTHSLKISFNPSLVAGFFPESSEKFEHKSKKGGKVLEKTLAIKGTKSLQTMFEREFLISHFFLLREEIRVTCSISKKQLVITQVPLCKQATSI